MKSPWRILPLLVLLEILPGITYPQNRSQTISFDFLGETVTFPYKSEHFVDFDAPLSQTAITNFHQKIAATGYHPIVSTLLAFRDKHGLDDWLFYQLIRKTAQQLSPKAANYNRYTLYKWFLLTRSGYDAILTISGDQILFYVKCDENIYNIPSRIQDGKQYVCLNYHDYPSIDLEKKLFRFVSLEVPHTLQGFSYKINRFPSLKTDNYVEKNLQFTFYQHQYDFKIRLNPEIKSLFNIYPVVDYESYFNIPLSDEAYHSLIPALKANLNHMSTKKGVDYLMRFTRDAFSFVPDSVHFGKEKRLSPELTLMYDKSDCEDRAALFFYLVKEIYNLPMLVLAFPNHVTIAVKLDKPIGKPVYYNGEAYSICEPTPQKRDLSVGELSPHLKKTSFEVAYAYHPAQK